MRYEFILAEKANYPVTVLCRCLRVSPSAYYDWTQRKPSKRSQEDENILERMRRIHGEHYQRYGSRRHHAELRNHGIFVGRNRVRRLMKLGELVARRRKPYRVTTKSNPDHPVAPNHLDRDFRPAEPNQAWVCDITYVPTTEGWLYLAIVLDLYSRRIVGWSLSVRATRQLVINALRMALKRRETAPGLLVHSDRGCQYTSRDHRRVLDSLGLVTSMSRRGNCWDNAVAESFFATLETELIDLFRHSWTRDQAGQEIFRYIESYYNRLRLHSTLGYRTPVQFEEETRSDVPEADAA